MYWGAAVQVAAQYQVAQSQVVVVERAVVARWVSL
jgi:hypothetical protein